MTPEKTETAWIWYGLCTYWTDDWSHVAGGKGQIPSCPKCGSPGFQATVEEWDAGIDRWEADGNHGYRAFLTAHRETCLGRGVTILHAWREYQATIRGQALLRIVALTQVGKPKLDPPNEEMTLEERDSVVEAALGYWYRLVMEVRKQAAAPLGIDPSRTGGRDELARRKAGAGGRDDPHAAGLPGAPSGPPAAHPETPASGGGEGAGPDIPPETEVIEEGDADNDKATINAAVDEEGRVAIIVTDHGGATDGAMVLDLRVPPEVAQELGYQFLSRAFEANTIRRGRGAGHGG